jgi:hypothetical protein
VIAEKIKHGWGYGCGPEAGAGNVVLNYTPEAGYSVAHWPTDNPPTIAEIEAVVLPDAAAEPDWPAFRLAMLQSPAFLRIANANAALFTILNSVMWLIASDPDKALETALVWNQLSAIAQPTEVEIAALNAIAADADVPLQLNSSGLMG